MSYLIVDMEKAVSYIDREKIGPEIMAGLIGDGVVIRPYEEIYDDIRTINNKILLDPDWVNYAILWKYRGQGPNNRGPKPKYYDEDSQE